MLKSYLQRNRSGFTLIELLVVIAIIAILVAIVVVAINPAERINESRDRAAASNVRSTGTLLGACMTRVLQITPPGTYSSCDTQAELDTYQLGKIATGVIVPTATATDLCAYQTGRQGTTWYYRQSTGAVSSQTTAFTC